jgi:fucose 4-O-acetylase-like acetyltransferase
VKTISCLFVKQRLHYIDQLKGIAILLVVMGHFIQYNTQEGTSNALFALIYSFHMPLFIFISGYVAQKTIRPAIFLNFIAFLRKKVTSLLLPFFAWPLLVMPFFLTQRPPAYHPLETVLLLLKDPGRGLWFLWYLFFLTVLYTLFLYATFKLNKAGSFLYDILILGPQLLLLALLHYISLVQYTDTFIFYFIFFYLGVFISKNNAFTSFILNKAVFSVSFILFLVLSGWYRFADHTLWLKSVTSVTAIFSLYYIVKHIKLNAFTDKTIRSWGQNSLVIYATQFPFICILPAGFTWQGHNFVPLFCITLFFSFIIIILCVSIFRIVQLCPPLNLLLYGNRQVA